MTTADADGIDVAGLLFDAGPSESRVLLEVGPEDSHAQHAKDPITLHDVFFRVCGAGVGRVKVNLRINSNGTLVDRTWIWRADHGAGVGWDLNASSNGLCGEWKRRHNLRLICSASSEIPGSVERKRREDLFPSVRDSLRSSEPAELHERARREWLGLVLGGRWSHESRGVGTGVYSVFIYPDVILTCAIEAPKSPKVRFHDIITVALGDHGNQPCDRRHRRGNGHAPTRDAEGDRLPVTTLAKPDTDHRSARSERKVF